MNDNPIVVAVVTLPEPQSVDKHVVEFEGYEIVALYLNNHGDDIGALVRHREHGYESWNVEEYEDYKRKVRDSK